MNIRYAAKFGLVLVLGGCASSRESAPSEVLGTPAPEASAQPQRDRDGARRMEEVWKAPFAVEHRGTRPDRQQRPAVVQVASPVELASAEPVPEPVAEPPATPAPATPAAQAPAPPRRTAEPLLGETVSPPPAARPPAARTPAQPPARTPARTQPAAPARPAAGARTHVVVQGETLFGLARRYGVSVDNLRTANKLPDDNIRIGQRLVIPAR